MRIFYYCYEKISPQGSANTHVIEVVENLVKIGHQVVLFLPKFERRFNYSRKGLIQYVYLPVVKLPLLIWILYDLFSLIYFTIFSLFNPPQIIYFRETQSLIPLLFAKMIHRKVFIEVNGWVIEELKMVGYPRWKLRFLEICQRFNFRHADGIITVSPGLTRLCQQTYRLEPEKLATVPNGTNPERFRALDQMECRQHLGLPPDCKYIGFVGSCYPYHGLENLIHAAPLVLTNEPETVFIIAGEGPAKADWQKLVQKLNLTDAFLFPGMVPTAEAPTWINAFTICVAPWRKAYIDEIGVSPLKLFDYMACSRPIVVSRIKGVTEIVERNQCGFAIDTEKPDVFAKYLLMLLRDRNLRESQGKNGRTGILLNHTWQITTEKILQFIDLIQNA